ncbi:hypothetical protein HPB52_017662 [Rhipicephalus sanguineus]|uniref:Uncharacterized protein n=1 Tax=Rhipicephalus sanguineus TaxID=34632 RepID=A0A9D4Q1E6_RHISA|nr:hypothetical protein HPB52_017662 [Rhipicephalus sanguineus]
MEDASVFFGRSGSVSGGARRVLQRAFRDGSLVPVVSVAIILAIMVTMAVMFQVGAPITDFYADVGHLLNVLEPCSILVDPLTAGTAGSGEGNSYFRSFFPYTADSIAKYRDFFARTVETERSKYNYICYPVSIAGYSLALEDFAASSVVSRNRRSSPPTIAVFQLKSGLAVTPYDATCATATDLRANVSIRLKFVVLAARKSQWVAYQDKNSLVQLLDALRQVTGGAPCLGVWDPEWDDISGHCSARGSKPDPYPLTKTIFTDRHRAPRLSATNGH